MRREQIDAAGTEVFALVASLLRSAVRFQQAGASYADGEHAKLPAQRLEMHLWQEGATAVTDLQLWLQCRIWVRLKLWGMSAGPGMSDSGPYGTDSPYLGPLC
jgi:hypothetical protein